MSTSKAYIHKFFDIITITDEFLFLTYIKSRLNQKDAEAFTGDILEFKKFFPEYANKGIIGIIGSLHIDEKMLRQFEKQGFLTIAPGEQIMDLLNSPNFEPKQWE